MGDFLELLKLPSDTKFAKYSLRQGHLYIITATDYFCTTFAIALERYDLVQRSWYTAMSCRVDRKGFLIEGSIRIENTPLTRFMCPTDLKLLYKIFSSDSRKFTCIRRSTW